MTFDIDRVRVEGLCLETWVEYGLCDGCYRYPTKSRQSDRVHGGSRKHPAATYVMPSSNLPFSCVLICFEQSW